MSHNYAVNLIDQYVEYITHQASVPELRYAHDELNEECLEALGSDSIHATDRAVFFHCAASFAAHALIDRLNQGLT